jgi:hypothetical protein
MKNKLVICALPMVVVLAIWVTTHFCIMNIYWSAGPFLAFADTFEGGIKIESFLDCISGTDRWTKPSLEFPTASYDEVSRELPELNPFETDIADPFGSQRPSLMKTLTGSETKLEISREKGFYGGHTTFPMWILFLTSLMPFTLLFRSGRTMTRASETQQQR